MEAVKVFDCMYNLLGTEDYNVVHRDGLWHETFHCWITRKRKGKIYVILQKRATTKKSYPNLIDISAAGHLRADETNDDGIRELEEELGVKTFVDKLIYLGVRVEVKKNKEYHDKEFQHVYLLEDDTPLSKYTLDEREVAGLVELELNDALRLLYDEIDSVKCNSVFLENGILKEDTYVLHKSDFIARIDGYYKKVFIAVQRYFAGEKYLSI